MAFIAQYPHPFVLGYAELAALYSPDQIVAYADFFDCPIHLFYLQGAIATYTSALSDEPCFVANRKRKMTIFDPPLVMGQLIKTESWHQLS